MRIWTIVGFTVFLVLSGIVLHMIHPYVPAPILPLYNVLESIYNALASIINLVLDVLIQALTILKRLVSA